MSDNATLAAEPTSTVSIIESSIADLPERDSEEISTADHSELRASGDLSETSKSTESGNRSTASQSNQPPTQAEVDELAAALGITDTGKGKWTTRVAYSKLHKVIKARDEKAKADHDAALKQHTDRISQFEQQVAAFDQMVSNPEALLANLAVLNPAYRRYLGVQPQQQSNIPERIETVEDLQRVIEQQVAERLRPIEEERATQQTIAAAVPKIRQQIADAEKWPLFAESKNEILAHLQQNPQADLRSAYQQVVIPKLAADRDKVRQEVLAEMKARPHSTSATTTTAGRSTPDNGPRETQDIIRESLRRQGL